MSVTLSEHQTRALDEVVSFVRERSVPQQWMTLTGLAGVGKTTVLAEVARRFPSALAAAPTGKAAAVLRSKLPRGTATTIHSLIYNFRGLVEDEERDGEMQPVFVKKEIELPDRLVLVDEVSMVGQRLGADLVATGACIVACGDPGQLQPVRDSPYFANMGVTLTEVHRQAWDSPIVRQAHRIRSEGNYASDGDRFCVVDRATPEILLDHDAILCWRNRTRVRLNAKKRELLGFEGPLRVGEPIMCLRNDHRLGLYNGEVYELAMPRLGNDSVSAVVRPDGDIVGVDSMTVEGEPSYDIRRLSDDWLPFAPAYAMTVHKAQGSEWPSVLVFDEAEQDWASFMYTAVTRASQRCSVVRWRT